MSHQFRHMTLSGWRQFGSVDIPLDKRMTILTGANGAGKTTILNLLARHFGWSISLIGTLRITKRGARRYYSDAGTPELTGTSPSEADLPPSGDSNSNKEVGSIIYSNEQEALLTVPVEVSENYEIQISNQQSVDGLYITSHRPVYAYQRVDQIPTVVNATEQLFNQYVANLRQYYTPRARIESPSFRLKSSLISLATFGYGNKAVQPDDDARRTFESFQEILRKVLPQDLGFREILIRLPDVIIKCEKSEFSLDAASGGIAALMDIAWQIHMKALTNSRFTVVLDEPENHLHPRIQRTVLPGLLDAFPNLHLIAATHNPFVVTSVSDSTVVVLDFIEGVVRSRNLSEFDRAASANQVLTDVLGVPFPMPLWVEYEVERVVQSLLESEISEGVLAETRAKLSTLGLGDMFPNVIERYLDRAGDRQ